MSVYATMRLDATFAKAVLEARELGIGRPSKTRPTTGRWAGESKASDNLLMFLDQGRLTPRTATPTAPRTMTPTRYPSAT